MWIPHTIPPVILRAYTPGDHRTDLETLQRQYDGRILRSEDPEWHAAILPKKGQVSLALLCLEMIIDGYEYYVQLTKCRNYILQREFNATHHISNENPEDDPSSITKSGIEISSTVALRKENLQSTLQFQKIPDVLDILTDLQRMAVIEELDVEEVPFHIAVETIPDEYFWQRAVATNFPNEFKCDTNWRKTYLRLYTENYIEQFNPREDDLNHLIKLVNLVSTEVTILKIDQILPYCYGAEKEIAAFVPIPEDDELGVGVAAEFDEGFSKFDELKEKAFRKQSMALRKDSEVPESEISSKDFLELQLEGRAREGSRVSISDALSSVRSNSLASVKENLKSEKSDTESQSQLEIAETNLQPLDRSSHLDFNEILPLFKCLKEVSLVFEVKNVGFEWDESFFKFTDEDCNTLANALGNSPTVEILEINRSHINGDQFKTLVEEGIINMPKLKKINISYNRVADIGASAISHLMENGKSKTLETILLGRNNITDEGAKRIGESLKTNNHVLNLDLRLNFIGNDGCKMIAEGLEHNKTLEHISLCGNCLDSSSCVSIGKMLCKNRNLKEIDLSCNVLTEKGGEYLYHALQQNNNLRKLDLRLTDIGYDLEYTISKCVENTKNRSICE